MTEQFVNGNNKYCPSCRNILKYHGKGRYECPLCCTHLVVLDKNPLVCYEIPFTEREKEVKSKESNSNLGSSQEQDEEVESHINQELSQDKNCVICGCAIKSGIYCKRCTFEQIKMMQRKDFLRDKENMTTDNYGNIRYKGYRGEQRSRY